MVPVQQQIIPQFQWDTFRNIQDKKNFHYTHLVKILSVWLPCVSMKTT